MELVGMGAICFGVVIGLSAATLTFPFVLEWMRGRERTFWLAELRKREALEQTLLNRVQSWNHQEFVAAEAQQGLIKKSLEREPEPPKEPSSLEEAVDQYGPWANYKKSWSQDGEVLTLIDHARRGVPVSRGKVHQVVGWPKAQKS